MHLCEDHFIAEIIDPDTGEVLPDGTKGELVFTSITKEAFPLLRYRTRDICVLDPDPLLPAAGPTSAWPSPWAAPTICSSSAA